MSMKLLPAAVNPVDPSLAPDAAISLVPLTQRAISTRAGQASLVPSGDDFAWSSSTRQGQAKFIPATLVEDQQGDGTGHSGWEYLSGWAWGHSVASTAIAHYLFYGVGTALWNTGLINLYA
jgi:hypothetical protein